MKWSRAIGAVAVMAIGVSTGLVGSANAADKTPSHIMAGYVLPTAASTTFRLRVTIPTLSCSAEADAPLFIHADMTGDVNGDPRDSGLVFRTYCSAPGVQVATYRAFLNDLSGYYDNAFPDVAASPGDELEFSGRVTVTGSGDTTERFTATDVTAGTQATVSGAGLAPTGLDLTETSHTGDRAPNAPVRYNHIQVDGGPLSAQDPQGYVGVDRKGRLVVRTSNLSAAGTAFTLTYVRSH
jgi:hypothetical protein